MNNWTIIKSTADAFDQLEKLSHLFCTLPHIVNLVDYFTLLIDLFFYALETDI